MRLHHIAAILLALFLAVPSGVAAQERYGTITGSVRDQGALALPGVSVKITNRESQRSVNLVTDETGAFTAPNLEPGRYSVRFELAGFISK